jgi:hypothetical protein
MMHGSLRIHMVPVSRSQVASQLLTFQCRCKQTFSSTQTSETPPNSFDVNLYRSFKAKNAVGCNENDFTIAEFLVMEPNETTLDEAAVCEETCPTD